MLSSEEREHIEEEAYLPEHLPDYVGPISEGEPYLHEGYLCTLCGSHLLLVGYPLGRGRAELSSACESAFDRFDPAAATVISPRRPRTAGVTEETAKDSYYRLDLPLDRIDPEQRYMVRRAARELETARGRFGKEHRKLVDRFISQRDFPPSQKRLYRRIGAYLKKTPTVHVIEVRKGGRLQAFTITDTGSARWAFYLFNVRSLRDPVPGASDLLFHEMVRLAEGEGKTAINLGLGINPGNCRFKEKWGGVPFLDYTSTVIRRRDEGLDDLWQKL